MEIFTLTLTLSLKGEGIAELRKSYQDRSYAVGNFTLTPSTSSGQALTLSLKGEGIAELRKSYPDSDDFPLLQRFYRVVGVAQVGQYLPVVLPQQRRRQVEAAGCAGELDGYARLLDLPGNRVNHFL